MITPTTAGIALVIALVVFGPGKLPELGKALGKGIKEFKDSANELGKSVDEVTAPVKCLTTGEPKASPPA